MKLPQAACALIKYEGKILAVSRRDDPTKWGLPGGKVNPGESPYDAAVRETEEETGVLILQMQLVFTAQCKGYKTSVFGVKEYRGMYFRRRGEGLVQWVDPLLLLAGPFGTYNRKLFKKVGINAR